MTIETKYNVGDEVWVSVKGEPTQGKVRGIDVHIGKMGDTIYGRVTYDVISYEMPYNESAVFPTKEELLKSL